MKQYINKNEKTIKITVDYNKGGYNVFNGKTELRGYYITAIPVEITEHKDSNGLSYKIEKTTAYSGYRYIIHETKRQSEKQYNEAINKAQSEINILLNEF